MNIILAGVGGSLARQHSFCPSLSNFPLCFAVVVVIVLVVVVCENN